MDDLPPSSPVKIMGSDDDGEVGIPIASSSPLRQPAEVAFDDDLLQFSDRPIDDPLASTPPAPSTSRGRAIRRDSTPSSESLSGDEGTPTRARPHRNSSLPPPPPPINPETPAPLRPYIASDDSVMYSPGTERKYLTARSHQKRLSTLSSKKLNIEKVIQNKSIRVFEDVLGKLEAEQYSLAQFLEYVFNPQTSLDLDWRYRRFFFHRDTVLRLLEHWRNSKAPTTRTLIETWALDTVAARVYIESTDITKSKLLSLVDKPVDAKLFLDYSLEDVGASLKAAAPALFRILKAASDGPRRVRTVSGPWLKRKSLMVANAALILLKAASSRNSYAQAVNGTYLMATGAQRQHFGVLSSLGITMSYSSVISHAPGSTNTSGKDSVLAETLAKDMGPANEVGENNGEKDRDHEMVSATHTMKEMEVDLPSLEMQDTSRPPPAPLDDEAIPTLVQKKKKSRTAGTLYKLSASCLMAAQLLAGTFLFIFVYDNINMMIRVAEQVLGRKNAQENGTCATIFPLHNAKLDDLRVDALEEKMASARDLSIHDLDLTSDEAELHRRAIIYTILRIIVYNGGEGFRRWKAELNKSQPMSSEVIDVHKTDIHPVGTFEIDENTTTGNIDLVNVVQEVLKVNREEAVKYIQLLGGDQLSIARQRAILIARLGHEAGMEAWKRYVLVPGLFHAKMADCHGLLATHFGKPNAGTRSPGSLAFHNQCLDRLPIVLSSLPTFRTCRDLIMVSLNARVLHCLLQVAGVDSLEEYLQSVDDFETLKSHATQILDRYTDTELVQELREEREQKQRDDEQSNPVPAKKGKEKEKQSHAKAGDMVFENAVLFMRDALLTREFADAVKCGDSGRVVIVLKQWALAYRGNGRHKYAHEMLHLIHNLTNVWPEPLRRVVLQNWILCPTGFPFSNVELDLVQEHLNFWVKRVYKAEGDAHSWEWLQMVTPCIDVLRQLANKMHGELGSKQGNRHSSPDLDKDIKILMSKLDEHSVYRQIPGRVLDDDEAPVPDVISVGYAALIESPNSPSNPLNEFNAQFNRLRSRLNMKPVTVLLAEHRANTLPTTTPDAGSQSDSITEALPDPRSEIDVDLMMESAQEEEDNAFESRD